MSQHYKTSPWRKTWGRARPIVVLFLFVTQLALAVGAQEKPLQVSGVFSLGYSNDSGSGKSGDRTLDSHTNEFDLGLDLNIRTYILDPRFIKITGLTNFVRNRGELDQVSTHNGLKGETLIVDFLQSSPYPLKFRFSNQSTDFYDRRNSSGDSILASTATGRKDWGVDWQLRMHGVPRVTVSYDNVTTNNEWLGSSPFEDRSRVFSVGVEHVFKGWEVNSNFYDQSAFEGFAGLTTKFDFLRADAHKKLTEKSTLFINGFHESLDFSRNTGLAQHFSLLQSREELHTRHSDKLTSRFVHHLYHNSGELESTQSKTAPAPEILSNTIEGDVSYRLRSEVTIGGTSEISFIDTANKLTENITRFLNSSVSINWHKRMSFVDTRASFSEGIANAHSNLGNSRTTEPHSLGAGVSVGNANRVVVFANYLLSSRPDVFQIGGAFSQNNFDVGVEGLFRGLRFRASVGESHNDNLTILGREHFHVRTYSAGIENRLFSLQFSRNSNEGLRDVFSVPVSFDPNYLFKTLPLDALIKDPLLNTSTVNTQAFMRIRPGRKLDVELRYIDRKSLFVTVNNIFEKQFDFLVTYRLGKFTLTGGALIQDQTAEGKFTRNRLYYFFRLSRPFKLL